jgi:hypothetical protein
VGVRQQLIVSVGYIMTTVPSSQDSQVRRSRARRLGRQFGVTIALAFGVIGLLGRLGTLDALGSLGPPERGPVTALWSVRLLSGAVIGGLVGGSLLTLVLGGVGRPLARRRDPAV